jgi:hypothetical protein
MGFAFTDPSLSSTNISKERDNRMVKTDKGYLIRNNVGR